MQHMIAKHSEQVKEMEATIEEQELEINSKQEQLLNLYELNKQQTEKKQDQDIL